MFLLIIACNGWIKYGYNVEEYDPDELTFPWGKLLCIFHMIYNFAVTITRIHFAICKVWSNNSNPENWIYHEKQWIFNWE